ncbi:major capsid protein [Thermus phage phiFa]|nr:major capsid protein [Thermus phage phiFa]
MARGIDSIVVLKRQTAQGTPATLSTSDYALPIRSESLQARPTVYGSEALRKQALRDRKLARLGTLDVGGSLEVEATNHGLDIILPLVFGQVTTLDQVGADTGVTWSGTNYGKKYQLSTADLPYATVAVYDGEVRRLFTDMKVSRLGLRAEINQLAMLTLDLVGIQASVDGTPVTATVPSTEYGLYFEHADVLIGDAGGNLTSIPVRSFSLDINTNPNTDRYRLGSRFRRAVPTGRFDITGSIEVDANSFPGDPQKFYTAVLNGQFLQLRLVFSDPTNQVTYTAGGTPKTTDSQFIVDIPFALIEWPNHNINGPDIITGAVNFTAYADGDTAVSVTHIYKL